MSDVDDGEDLEFLKAFEDELYNDQLSVGSDDSLDSELEAELYQSVHFASSLLETPTNNSKEEKVLDKPIESTSLELLIEQCSSDGSIVRSKCDGRKQLEQVDGLHDGQQIRDTSRNHYPEVELVFSKDEPKNKLHNVEGKTGALFEAKPDGGDSDNGGSSDGNGWGIIAADLLPAKKVKRQYVRCYNCHEMGHRTLECTAEKKEKVCWLCGEIGHLRKRCKNDVCFNCNQTGHQMKKCPERRCHSQHKCKRCRAHGHFESFCPDRWRQYHHTIDEGEIVQAIKPEFERQDVSCYNCGEKGHLGHECLKETPFFSYRVFPFVVKYDRFTSNFLRFDGNDETDANTDLTSRPNGKKSKKKKKKRKRTVDEEALGEGKKARKRRKLEDGLDAEGLPGNPRDNRELPRENRCDQLETSTDLNHVTSNLPLQPLMDVDFGDFARGKKKKRKMKNTQEQLTDEVPVKKKKSKPNQQKKKRLKKMKLKLQQKYGNTGKSNINLESASNPVSATHSTGNATSIAATHTTINTLTMNANSVFSRYSTRSATASSGTHPTMNATSIPGTQCTGSANSISETHHTKNASSTSAINPTNSATSISGANTTESAASKSSILSTATATTGRNLVFQLGKERRLLVVEEAPKKPWRRRRNGTGDKRKVYFKYNGFL